MRVALIGCGRLGRMHAENLARHEKATLAKVHDLHRPRAQEVAGRHGVPAAQDVAEIFSSPVVDAVLVASSTDTHADLIETAVAFGKPVLCEKPIDLDPARVNLCARRIAGSKVPAQIGFNRRFDPGHRAARQAVLDGEIGELHQVLITSRDPEMPARTCPDDSGRLLRDTTIHDFDLARFMLGEEPEAILAIAGRMIDRGVIGEPDDHDTAMTLLRTASGRQWHINNSRNSVYGYDQRVELLGSRGMVLSDNRKAHGTRRYSATGVEVARRYLYFFVERYQEAYMAEIDAFLESVETGSPPEPGFEDGRQAMRLAEAGYLSIRERRLVRVDEVE